MVHCSVLPPQVKNVLLMILFRCVGTLSHGGGEDGVGSGVGVQSGREFCFVAKNFHKSSSATPVACFLSLPGVMLASYLYYCHLILSAAEDIVYHLIPPKPSVDRYTRICSPVPSPPRSSSPCW